MKNLKFKIGSELVETKRPQWGTWILKQDSNGLYLQGERGEKAFDIEDQGFYHEV